MPDTNCRYTACHVMHRQIWEFTTAIQCTVMHALTQDNQVLQAVSHFKKASRPSEDMATVLVFVRGWTSMRSWSFSL